MFLKFSGVKLGDTSDSNTRFIEPLAPNVLKNLEALELVGCSTPPYLDNGGELSVSVKVDHQFENEEDALSFAFSRCSELLDIGVGNLQIIDFGGKEYNFENAALESSSNEVKGVCVEFIYNFKVSK